MRTYHQDYAGWVEDTAQAIEAGHFDQIDRVALADEVRDLGKTERRELISALRVLLLHLLKTKYQPERATRSWEASIAIQRDHINELLEESPSLRPSLPDFLRKAYAETRVGAANETGLEIDIFPTACEWTLEEVMAQSV